MDGIELEILWSNLIGIVSEQAKALQRIAFSPIVREAGDLASGLFDAQGRMVAQANTGTPGHINSLAAAGKTLAGLFHNQLVPGDVIITNDPWMSAGHFFDITVLTPIFRDERLIGYIGSTIHHTDIGGYGIGAGARDIHEEGLWIPPSKFYEAGVPNALLHDIIRHNVRTPDHVAGVQRRRIGRVDDRALGGGDLDRGQGAVVVGLFGVEAASHREGGIGVGVVHHHVDPQRTGPAAAGEVDQDVAGDIVHRDRRLELDDVAAGNIEAAGPMPGPGRQGADRLAGRRL